MRSIALSVLVWVAAAIAAPAQITVGGGAVNVGIPSGATIWSGAIPPSNSTGANGDYYLNTSSYCLYGPKADEAWPSACVSSVRQLGYVAENTGNKSAPGGYAPLDANAHVPAANLPAIAAINGTSVPGNNASDQTVVTTAPSVGAWTALPACPDTGGNHLNYSSVTHGFLCGNTGGTAGSVSFGGVGSGANANALQVAGTLDYTGGGQINANQLGGVSLASLSTGLLKNTAGTGVPSVATSADVTSTLGFTPATYPTAGVPASTGGAWGSSYTVGTGAGNLVQLDGSSQLPPVSAALLTNWPTFNQSTTGTAAGLNGVSLSGLATGLLKNTTGTGVPSIAADGTDFVSPASLNGATLPASVTTVATTSDITSGGNVYANSGSSAAGCVQLGDSGAAHTTGWCAPPSGVSVLWNLPGASDADGQLLLADGSHNLSWSGYWTMPHLTGLVTFAPPAATSGTPTLFTLTAPAHTTLAAGTEANDLYFNLNRAVQFTGGTGITTQRAALFTAPTYRFSSSATTITNAATVAISGAPVGGTNSTISNAYGLWVQSGALANATNGYGARFDAPTGATNNYSASFNGTLTATGALVKNSSGNASLTVQAYASQNTPLLQVQNSSAVNQVAVDKNFNVSAPVIAGATGAGAPTITCNTATYTGAGTGGGTCSLAAGSDVSGSISVTTGSGPVANGPLLSFQFGNTHTAAPGMCTVQFFGAPLAISQQPWIEQLSATAFTVYSGSSTALTATHAYTLSYMCI